MFIAIEGVDASGKSTLVKFLTEKLLAESYSTPPKKYLQFREKVDKDSSPEDHYRFYKESIYDASDEIKVMLKNNKTVISDRYWLSTYVYHEVMGAKVTKEDFASIQIPDLTVILSIHQDTQIGRLLHRGMSAGDKRVLHQQKELGLSFYKNAFEFNIPFLILNTGFLSTEECVNIIIQVLKKK